MARHALVAALATATLVAAGCGGDEPSTTSSDHPVALPPHRATPAMLVEEARQALFAADTAHTDLIAQLGPIDGVLASLRPNAVYVTAGIDLVRGRDEIRAALVAENPDPQNTSLARTLLGGDVSADGNFGFTFGWLLRTAPAGVTYGAYVAIWERDTGEDFRVTTYFSRSSVRRLPVDAGFPLLLGGAGAGGVPRAGRPEEQRRSVIATDKAFSALSVAQGSSIAFPAYADDFLLVFGGNFVPLVGHDAIAAAYAGGTPAEVLEWSPVYAGAAASGDLAYTVGNAIDSYTFPDGTVSRAYSKYLTLWARNAAGEWRFMADGGASSPAPTAPAKR